jgi:PAS domain S-box-containing protein
MNGRIIDVNKAAIEQMMYSRNEIIGRSIFEFFAPESIGSVEEVVRLPVAEAYEAHLIRKDGQKRIVQIKARSMDLNGQPTRVATIMDVTEQVSARKQIEELMHKEEEERIRLKTILDTLPVGVRVTDMNGRTELTNDRQDEIYREQQPINSQDESMQLEGERDGSNKNARPEDLALYEAIRQGKPVIGMIFDMERFDGTIGTIMVSASQIRNDQGAVIGGVATTQDITELRMVQKELARSNADLQQFANVASHDLQAPLRMISSYLQLLEKRNMNKLDEASMEYISFAVDGAKSMKCLIKDILDYSKVGSQGTEFLPTDMDMVIGAVIRDLDSSIAESGATILHEHLPKVKADQTQMVQLLENLVGNAIKFQGERAPIVHISAKKVGHFWEFSVMDNGIGFDIKFKGRIFEMFQRLHTKEEYKGTGIGLAICKRIVERHGGQIWAESEIGNGTTFFFTIPIGPPDEGPSPD